MVLTSTSAGTAAGKVCPPLSGAVVVATKAAQLLPSFSTLPPCWFLGSSFLHSHRRPSANRRYRTTRGVPIGFARQALPKLNGKLTASAIRVPTPNVSMVRDVLR